MNNRSSARLVPETIDRLKRGSLFKTVPPTYYAMKVTPPPPSLAFQVNDAILKEDEEITSRRVSNASKLMTGQKNKEVKESAYRVARHKLNSGMPLLGTDMLALSSPCSHGSHRARNPKPYPRQKKAIKIVYEEDYVRRMFFRDHPMEVYRPKMLLENEAKRKERKVEGKEWRMLCQLTTNPSPEDCIAFTLHLVQTHKLPLIQGYATSISQYRSLRSEHEIATRAAVREAKSEYGYQYYGAVERGNALEEQALDEWEGDKAQAVKDKYEVEFAFLRRGAIQAGGPGQAKAQKERLELGDPDTPSTNATYGLNSLNISSSLLTGSTTGSTTTSSPSAQQVQFKGAVEYMKKIRQKVHSK